MGDLDELMAAFAGVNVDDHDELSENFARILGVDGDQARFFLEASTWSLEAAIGMFLDTVGSRVRAHAPPAPPSPPPIRPRRRPRAPALRGLHAERPRRCPAQTNMERAGSTPRSIFKGDETVQQIGALAFAPGQPIDIVWAFINSGEAAWPLDAVLAHCEGDSMGGAQESSVGGCQPSAEAAVQLRLTAPAAGGTSAGCWRLRYSQGFFGDPIWLVVNVDPAQPPYAGGEDAAAAQAQAQQQAAAQQQMMAAQMMAQGAQTFGQVQPGAGFALGGGQQPAAAEQPGQGRLFQQAAAGAGIGVQPAAGAAEEDDDMDL